MAVVQSNKSTYTYKQGIHTGLSVLLALLLSFSVFRYITEPQDNDRCHGMLQEGKWMTDEYKQWQPSGCMAKTYRANDIAQCLEKTHVIYIGDSIMREQYYAMSGLLNIPKPEKDAIHSDQKIHYKKKDITVEIWWDPYLNTTRTVDLLAGKSTIKPSLLVIGSGIWYMRRTGSNYLQLWKEAVDRVFDGAIHHRVADRIMLSPVEIVERDKLIPIRNKTLTEPKIHIMNNYLREKESSLHTLVTPLVVPFVWNEIVTSSTNQTVDGLHFKTPVTAAQTQLNLNYRCNQQIVKPTFPYETTCCFAYPSPKWYQSTLFFYFLILVPLGYVMVHFSSNHPYIDFIGKVFPLNYFTLTALFVFGLSVIYMYLGDRSQLFGKIFKQFDTGRFTVLMILLGFLGTVTLKKSNSDEDAGFLNRDQTDEWKGWMQLIILVYHFVGASSVSGIYNPVRVLVAAYLFQTGYGHFFFFYKKADYSISRILNVMVRLNLLTCVLAYTMRTDYLFYYFSPLVSFWFAVIWITMRILSSYNTSVPFVLFKMAVMAVITGFIIHYPGVLEGGFSVLRFLFNIQWDVTGWRFRLALDAWIVYIGMLTALLTIKITENKVSKNQPQLWNTVKYTTVLIAAIAMVGSLIFEFSQVKSSYTKFHPYTSWIPILAFVVLRNFSFTARNTHSRFFAFIGKISLETFIGQFHMWLAADTKGLLIVLPNANWVSKTSVGWWTNLIVSSLVFVFVCYHLSQATGVLTKWICAGSKQSSSSPIQKEQDVVPLLPAESSEAPAKLMVSRSSEDSDIELGDGPLFKEKPTWYNSLYHATITNYWIKSAAFLFLMGIVNRFCV